MKQLRAQGLTYPVYVLISVIVSTAYAPPINMLEAEWRGFLYPQMKAKLGKGEVWLIGYE